MRPQTHPVPVTHMGKRKRQAEAEAAVCSRLLCNEGLDDADADAFDMPCTWSDSPEEFIRSDSACSDQTEGPAFPRSPFQLSPSPAPEAGTGNRSAAASAKYFLQCLLAHGDEEPGISLADLPRLPAGNFLPRLAASFGFSELAVSFGSSYFYRMAQVDQILHASAAVDREFMPLIEGICRKPRHDLGHLLFSRANLLATFTVCVHLAAKLLEDVRPLPLLQHMLQTIFQSTVTRQQTEALEAQCLRALDWRLGPFFND